MVLHTAVTTSIQTLTGTKQSKPQNKFNKLVDGSAVLKTLFLCIGTSGERNGFDRR